MNRLIRFLKHDLFFISLLIFLYIGTKAQETHVQDTTKLENLKEYTEQVYGTDDRVVNGKAYLPKHFNAKGHPYFLTDIWIEGTLVIDSEEYEGQEILYNIDIEKLILKTTLKSKEEVLLVLNTDFIEALYFGDHYFVNGAKYFPTSKFTGFVEQVYDGNFKVVIRHKKSFVSQYTVNSPHGFYSGTKSMIYIFDKGELEKLPTKKTMLDYFFEQKKEIKKFLRKNKIKYNKATTNQLSQLFTYCDDISSK
jgi:hypothetical protein